MTRRLIGAAAVAVLLAAFSNPVRAATISTLFNTGVNSSGAALPDGTSPDPHYSLISVPSGSGTTLVRAPSGGYPYPPYPGSYYKGDTSKSLYIGPDNGHNLSSPVGSYTYQTTFDLSAYVLSTVVIKGGWIADNIGKEIILNGHDLGVAQTNNNFLTGFTSFGTLPVADLLPGVNTLDFVVVNSPGGSINPTSLRVAFTTQTADLKGSSPIPEPASILVFGSLGALGFVGYCRRRRNETR